MFLQIYLLSFFLFFVLWVTHSVCIFKWFFLFLTSAFQHDSCLCPGPSKSDKKVADVKKAPSAIPEENDTFFVVVNDKKLSSVSVSTSKKDNNNKPALAYDVKEEEVASRDETDSNNEVNRAVLLGGVLVAAPPPRHGPPSATTACRPDCSPARNELCQRVSGHMRCVCRPGFARMFPDRPCKRK